MRRGREGGCFFPEKIPKKSTSEKFSEIHIMAGNVMRIMMRRGQGGRSTANSEQKLKIRDCGERE
jgi:hypothetical protein